MAQAAPWPASGVHSPTSAAGWDELTGRVRGALDLPSLWRGLAMCGVAELNGAAFERHHHALLNLQAGGREARLAALRALDDEMAATDPVFDAGHQAVLALVVEMTRQV